MLADDTAATSSFVASHGVVAMAPSDGKVWIALSNGGIEVRDAYCGAVSHFFEPPRSSSGVRPWCMLAVGEEGQQQEMWVGLSTGTIEVIDCSKYCIVRQLRKHVSGVYCLSSDRASVFAGSSDFTMTQWRAVDGQLLRVYTGHANYVRCLYAEGSSVFSGSDDQTIRMWDSTTGECRRVLTYHGQSGGVSALCRVGVTMWSGDSSGLLVRWSIANPNTPLSVVPLHPKRIVSIELVGSHVYVAFSDGTTVVLVGITGEMVNKFSHGSPITTMKNVAVIDRMYWWSGAADNTVRCWHHDERHSTSLQRQRCDDMRHFYSIQQPYTEKNNEAIDQLLSVRELRALADGGEKAIQAAITSKQVDLLSKAAQALVLASTLGTYTEKFTEKENECRKLRQLKKEKSRALESLMTKVRNLDTAVQTLQSADPEVVNTIMKLTAPPVTTTSPP